MEQDMTFDTQAAVKTLTAAGASDPLAKALVDIVGKANSDATSEKELNDLEFQLAWLVRPRRSILVGAFAWAFGVVAMIASSMALINAIGFVVEFGLDVFLQRLAGYYRAFSEPMVNLIALVQVREPQVVATLILVCLVGVFINLRLSVVLKHREETNKYPTHLRHSWMSIAAPYNVFLFRHFLSSRKAAQIRYRHVRDLGHLRPIRSLEARDELALYLFNQTLLFIVLIPVGVLMFFVYHALKVTG